MYRSKDMWQGKSSSLIEEADSALGTRNGTRHGLCFTWCPDSNTDTNTDTHTDTNTDKKKQKIQIQLKIYVQIRAQKYGTRPGICFTWCPDSNTHIYNIYIHRIQIQIQILRNGAINGLRLTQCLFPELPCTTYM